MLSAFEFFAFLDFLNSLRFLSLSLPTLRQVLVIIIIKSIFVFLDVVYGIFCFLLLLCFLYSAMVVIRNLSGGDIMRGKKVCQRRVAVM